jgi:hypothetical protein
VILKSFFKTLYSIFKAKFDIKVIGDGDPIGFGREKEKRNVWPAQRRKTRIKQGMADEPPSPPAVAGSWPPQATGWLEGGGAATPMAWGGGPPCAGIILFYVLVFIYHLKFMCFS